MSLQTILKGIEKNHDVTFRKEGFARDLSIGDFIRVNYYKLDYGSREFHLPKETPTSSLSMHVERLSCEWSDDEYGTNAITDNGVRGKSTIICSDGTVSVNGYVIGAWYNLDVVD